MDFANSRQKMDYLLLRGILKNKHLFTYCQLYWKDESKEDEAVIGPFFNLFVVPIV